MSSCLVLPRRDLYPPLYDASGGFAPDMAFARASAASRGGTTDGPPIPPTSQDTVTELS